jgi:hypothetical protein
MSYGNAPETYYDKSIKQKEQIAFYALDIAGNNVPVPLDYIPTIKSVLKMDMKDEIKFEEFIKRHREPSPCPCRSEECLEVYNREKKEHETLKLLTLGGNVILKPHSK